MFRDMVKDLDDFELNELREAVNRERYKRLQNEANNKLKQKGKWGI